MSWAESPDEVGAVIDLVLQLEHRWEIEEALGRCYGLRGTPRRHGVEYTGPQVSGWLRVRYATDQRALAAVFVAAP